MSLGPALHRLAGVRPEAADSDAALVTRFLATRDEAAFTELFERHGRAVAGVCRRMLGHTQDAEDAAQAVFLALARHAGAVRKQASLAAWLHGVAVRVCRKALARRARTRSPAPTPEPLPDPAEALSWVDARRAIDAALADLPESLRLPLVLCYLQGLTRDEAAERLGWSQPTFRGRLERGRERLRAALEARGFPLSVGLVTVLLFQPAAGAAPASVVPVALGRVPAPRAAALVPRVRFPMKTSALIVLLACAAVGVAWVGDPQPRPATPKIEPPARLLAPDPKAAKVAAEFAGVWEAEQKSATSTRTQTLRFLDGKHLLWEIRVRSPGVDTGMLLRGTYQFEKDGTLLFEVAEKSTGLESLPVRPAEATRRYAFACSDATHAAFRLKFKGAPGEADVELPEFRKPKGERPAAPEIPAALRGLDRTIKKEPKYAGKPLYLLLVFGAEAEFKVWAVLDGTTLYVDRNGNGDLTDDGEKVEGEGPAGRGAAFRIGDLTDAAGKTKHTDLMFSSIRIGERAVMARIAVRTGGTTLQLAGPTNLRLTESPADAQVIHFGSSALTVRPSIALPGVPDAGAASEFRVQVGTPGIGPGSFASFACEHLPEGTDPKAEFVFPSARPNEPPQKVLLPLARRCCADHFYVSLRVPEGCKTGTDAARVTLSFPNSPWGKIDPVTYSVDVIPKPSE
jgi:RNA polymerase sigma factor (sigma-70 family)